ncbi:MAG TPA: hypothetical protein VGN34_35005 [Ktedonobacteraceae bacterium]|jgi:hypothetical protein
MYIAKLLLIAVLGLCGGAILSSCDLGISQAGVLPMLHQVSPVDSSPGKLGVRIVLNEDQNAIDGKVAIEMRFMDVAIRNPNDVQFTDRETITCNGVPLVYDVTSYTYDADIISTSNNYRCLYTSHGHTSTLAVPIQTQLAPTYVLSGTKLNIHYNPSNKNACFVQVVASDSLHVQAGLSRPDDGLYGTMDVSELRGSGKLQFTRTCNVVRPSVFHAVTVSYQATRSIDVIWKHAAR